MVYPSGKINTVGIDNILWNEMGQALFLNAQVMVNHATILENKTIHTHTSQNQKMIDMQEIVAFT